MCVNGDTGKDNVRHTADYTFSAYHDSLSYMLHVHPELTHGGILSETEGLHEILTVVLMLITDKVWNR